MFDWFLNTPLPRAPKPVYAHVLTREAEGKTLCTG